MNFKLQLHNKCLEICDTKIKFLEAGILDLTQGALNDSKSSAGDKHETARAMMQIEHEKLSRQLSEAINTKSELEKLHPDKAFTHISKGALVKTNLGYIYVSIALGKIVLGNESVIVMSPKSPLGEKITGLSIGDYAEVNATKYFIEEIS